MSRMSAIHAELPADDQPAPAGHNNPPPDRPYEAVKAHGDDLMTEAKAWCDGAEIESQAQADTLSRLLDDLRKAHAATDAARRAEAKPFDDGKAEVQARYTPLLKRLDLGLSAVKQSVTKWLAKVEADKRAVAEAARLAAEEAAAQARVAVMFANPANLEEREQAEQAVTAAKVADRVATRAEKDKAAGLGGARAVTLRTYWIAEIADLREAARHYWAENPEGFRSTIQAMADADVRSGKRQLPGITIKSEQRAV